MERTREAVFIDDRTFWINRPCSSDWLLEYPVMRAACAVDESVPYWSEIWPASRMLAKAILREPWESYPKWEALEIACGLGLSGIAALSRGLRVTFSDIDAFALRFAAENAKLNGFTDFSTQPIDLRNPPTDLKVPVLFGADLLYESRLIEDVAKFIDTVLAPDGMCLIADPDRLSARPFRGSCENLGLKVETAFARAGEPGGERTKGTIYRITHRQRA